MATYPGDAPTQYAGTASMSYPGQPMVDLPVQERLNTLTNVLRASHALLDELEGVPMTPAGENLLKQGAVNQIGGPGSMPGLCSLAEQAYQLAEHLDQRVRTLAGRLGRL